MISNGTTTYFHQDDQSVRLATDANGNVLSQEGTFPFGEQWYQSGSGNEWVFTSYDRDSESGLDYALARYYDSRTGTFCSADPLAGDPSDPQSWNRYPYGRDDPIDITDPSGQSWWSSLLIDIGVAVAAYFAPEALTALAGGGAGATAGTTTMTILETGQSSTAYYLWGAESAAIGGGTAAGIQAGNHSSPAKPSKAPCYPNVKKFVDDNLTAAQSIAKQIGNGATAQEVLATSGAETTYGSPQSLAAHGNFFGLHGGGFPGQIGSYTTKPAYGPGVVTPVFPSSSGFALSGQVFANHENPFFANGNASDPGNFFQTIHAHGYGTGNSSYMNKVMDHTDPKSGRLIHGSYSLVGGCL